MRGLYLLNALSENIDIPENIYVHENVPENIGIPGSIYRKRRVGRKTFRN